MVHQWLTIGAFLCIIFIKVNLAVTLQLVVRPINNLRKKRDYKRIQYCC